MKTHLCYIVLWATSLLILWGFMSVSNHVEYWVVVDSANKEPYSLKQKVKQLTKENRALYRELAQIKKGRE